MQTVFAMESTAKTAPFADDSAVSISIVAGSSALRARIERLARRAGARVFGESSNFEVLLLAIDSATPLPTSVAALTLLAPATAHVCAIWCGSAPTPGVISQLLRAGVAGIVPIDIEGPKFRAALTAIRAGLQVVDPVFMREQKASERTNSSAEELTDREQQVLAMMGEGLSNKEISSRMAISTHTVKFHISSILGKLGAASRTEAVSIGVKTGRLTI